MTPTELSLIWCYSRPFVASTIIGATSMTQLKENIAAYSKCHIMTEEVLADINSVYKRFRDPSKV